MFLKRLLRNEGIDLRLKIKPLTVIAIVTGFSVSFGTGFNVARILFPNSSPILNREVVYQGVVQQSQSGVFYLTLADSSLYKLQPKSINVNLSNVANKQVMVKGNLTREPNLIEVNEVIVLVI